ncbi:hypothetical protein H6P81_000895 [Aristolochia fimbriata]|uniref:Pectinesterase inhibitor domain-containing protein n=1 Tax=Aristolochia fimbriata TaxID=158543 RepID=A0AAV7F8Q2_ARIFI|nr:hypothetical protein H6P81_000895 [Aristolochia fimbriata]
MRRLAVMFATVLVSVLIVLTYNVVQAAVPSESAVSHTLEQVCKGVDDYKFCLTTLQADPRSSSEEDLRVLWNVSLDLTNANISTSLKKIDALLAKEKELTYKKKILRDCKRLFSDGVSYTVKAKRFFVYQLYFEAGMCVNGTIKNSETCQSLWTQGTPKSPPLLTTETSNLTKISFIANAILKLWVGG